MRFQGRPLFNRSSPIAKRYSALFLFSLIWLSSVTASILDLKQLKIDFAGVDAINKATWSEPDKITLTAAGLGREGDQNSLRQGWIQTEPYAIGFAWRPTTSASIKATISPPPQEYKLPNGQTHQRIPGHLFVRYSPDCKNWSSWQTVQHDLKLWREKKEVVFQSTISIPQRDREEYLRLLEAYRQEDVPWTSDEDAAVRWMIAREPKIFERAIPFMGYVQFLYETDFYGGQRISSFSADIGYGMSGMSSFPRDKDFKMDMEKAWHYRAKE